MKTLLSFVGALLLGLNLFAAETPKTTPQKPKTPARKIANSIDQPGSLISGFKLVEVRTVKEADGTARLFEHEKTGARLLYLSNSDDNKLFAIGFRTPPKDNTGVPHILEHSVLCGSRKFPTKEPFVELLKGSVNTFVNAMTYSDKTIYPVASRNDKDFRNLMDVYMDAVLHPNIYQNPYTLMQEGWRFELEDKTGDLTYNGVVFNEMKGALSSPDRLLGSLVQRNLFPKITYGFESGGDPLYIPRLTPRGFLGFHKKFYHPSNSYIFLYGNGNVEEHLRFLDEQYLAEFKKKKIHSDIPMQPAFTKPAEMDEFYSVNPGESTQGHTYMGLSYAIGKSTDPELFLAMDILEYLLLETDSSPLKRAILEAGLGKSIEGYWDPTIQQPVFAMLLKGTDPEKRDAFKTVVTKTLELLVAKGIDPKLVEASINRKEFLLREFDTQPKGLAYYDKVMDSWLYGGDPLIHVQFEPTLEKIKKLATTGYFENLIKQNLLKNNHRSLVVLSPKVGLEQQRADVLKSDLKRYKASLKPSELKEIMDATAELKKRQSTPDSQEALEKIPLLEISDINPKAEILPIQENLSPSLEGTRFFNHSVFTNKIAYLNLYFDIAGLTEAQLPYAALLSDLLGKIDTEKRSFQDLSNSLGTHTGGFGTNITPFSDKKSLNEVYPKFQVSGKALLTKLTELSSLTDEILLHSKLENTPAVVSRIKEIVQDNKAKYQDAIVSSGHRYAFKRLASYLSFSGKLGELTSGISYFQFLNQVEKELDKNPEKVLSTLKDLSKLIFSRTGLLVSFTSPEADFLASRPRLEKLTLLFPALPMPPKATFELRSENEGLMIPSKVQYVVKGADFRKAGFDYTGKLLVANNYISNDYLWNRVRVLGGAYGSWMQVAPSGILSLISYRDPGLRETLDTYGKISDFLKSADLPAREVKKYILGTVSELDTPLSPANKGQVAMSQWITKTTQNDVQKIRDEVLATQLSDIKLFAPLLEKAIQQNAFVVIGDAQKIQENKSLFGKIVQVME